MPIGTVLLLPGFLGSSLTDASFLGFAPSVWLDPVRLLTGGFPRLSLAVPGDPPAEAYRPLVPGRPLDAYYGLLRLYLESRGWRVVSPAADWRRPLAEDAGRAAELLVEESAAGPVHIVGHSRGGLLARAVIGTLRAQGKGALVGRVVGLGVPHLGSLNAVVNLGGGGSIQRRLADLGADVRPPIFPSPRLDSVYAVMRSWPALYELLPAPTSVWMSQGDPNETYSPGNYAASPLAVVPAYLAAAKLQWASLPAVPDDVDWTDVCGYGRETYLGITDTQRLGRAETFTTSTLGDGTVPYGSSHEGNRRLILTPCQHDLLCHDARIWPFIDAALAGTLTEDKVVHGPPLRLNLI